MCMKEFNTLALESIKSVEKTLPKTMFKNFLLTNMKQYIVTPLLVESYSDIISVDEFCARPMSNACVKYLMERGDFNYDKWVANINNNDLTILLDDSFIVKYNPDTEAIFNNVSVIPKAVYDKYIHNASDEVKRCLLTKCKEVNDYDIVENIQCLLPKDFGNTNVNKVISRPEVLDKIFTDCTITNIVSFLVIIHKYPCLQYADKFNSFDFDSLSDDDYVKYEGYYVPALTSIITSYPVDDVGVIMKQINYSNSKIFQVSGMREVLLYYLTTCNNIEEDVLISLIDAFAVNTLQTELKNYGKNYNYKNLLLALAL